MKISKILVLVAALFALTSASALADSSVGQSQNVVCAAGASGSGKDASPAPASHNPPAGQLPAPPAAPGR